MPVRKFKDDRGMARRAMGMREAEAARKRRGLTRLQVGNAVWLNKTESERRQPGRLALLLIACYFALAMFFMAPAYLDPMIQVRHIEVRMFTGMGVFVLLQLVMPIFMFAELRRRPEAMLRYRVCACCGYDLRGAAAEEDGCTVCPECGAAYDMSVRAAPLGRTLRPVWRFVPWFDDRWRHIRWWGRLDPNAPEAGRTIQKQLGLGRHATWWVVGYLAIVAAFAGLVSRAPVDEPETLASYVLLGAAIVASWVTTFLTNRALRRARFCVACFSSLESAVPDPDGRTTCPTCGAAWKLPAETDDRAAAGSEVA